MKNSSTNLTNEYEKQLRNLTNHSLKSRIAPGRLLYGSTRRVNQWLAALVAMEDLMLDDALLATFVESFGKFDDFMAIDPIPTELDGGTHPNWDYPKRKPASIVTDASALKGLYERIPGPLPALYERLVLSYRWLEVYLGDPLRLLANPPGPGLERLAEQIAVDPVFVKVLFPLGLIPFGKAGDIYDPVCFDLATYAGDGDCRIMRVEHESVLCDNRVGETWVIADSFRSLVASYADGGGKAMSIGDE